jgi:hypothetical protein
MEYTMFMFSAPSLSRSLRTTLSLLTVAVIAACGGGGDNSPGAVPGINSKPTSTAGGGEAVVPKPTLAVTLTDQTGASTNTLSASKFLNATAVFKDAAGAPIANALVAFSSDASLAVLAPASGTVLTDSAGKATVRLSAPSLQATGAGLVKVAATVGDQAVLGQAAFTLGATSISLNLVTPAASPALLKAYASTVVTIDVFGSGVLLANDPQSISLASFCASNGKASLPAEVTTVNGRAQVVYRDLGCAQADTVTASIGGTSAMVKAVFQISPPDAASIEVGSILPSDRSIVIKGAGGSGRSESATVQFRVLDQYGNPLANQPVTFSTISTKAVTLSKSADVTDAQGQVVTTVNSGTEPTAVRVQALLATGQSTISDIITVTTGLPIQAAFSLSAEPFNIEGMTVDNAQADITLLLADQFGNPVADGTPVVFQTDSGAVGTSDRGGCITVNGGCAVPLRSQNPRYSIDASAPQRRAGLATVSVSTSNNSNVPLTGKIAVFFSGSFATRITRVSNGVDVPVPANGVDLTRNDCDTANVRIRINDSNNNPMPKGTILEVASATNAALAILPTVVGSIAPTYNDGYVTGAQGSVHVIAIMPESSKCMVGGSVRAKASATVTITTPRGNVTTFPVTVSYPAAAL